MSPSFDNPGIARSRILVFLDRLPARGLAVYLAAVLLVLHSVVTAQPQSWPTLNGEEPLVIAHGGFSGMFPACSERAYTLALRTTTPNHTALWCNLQLTKDAVGICFPDILLDNSSDIFNVFKVKTRSYLVDGALTPGYFSIDYKYEELSNVDLIQGIFSRNSEFNAGNHIQTVHDMASLYKEGTFLWLNIQRPSFYNTNGLNMTTSVLSITTSLQVNYISSPDLRFLESIKAQINTNTTKLVFRFLEKTELEPSTNKTYGSILKDSLTFIKTFASGILVPKSYIWPVDSDKYLQPHTNLVSDAHKLELEVHASGFMNDDDLMSYNYSYDPVAESLNFIDNDNFSVDGLLSDYPITQADAIACFSKHAPDLDHALSKALIISKEGASGDYPGCTDLAYNKAISDGVDILDCPVQMSKDGTPFCLGSINLMDRTTVAQSSFSNRSTSSIPEINAGNGIYTFSLTWEEIRTLTPEIFSPFAKDYKLFRNPKHKHEGKLLSLSDFLALANRTSTLTGVLINIMNAAYLAEYQGLGVIDSVLDELSKAGYDKKKTQTVMIQSTNSSVLKNFHEKGDYELVYQVDEVIEDVGKSAIEDIKTFAHSVVIEKTSVFPQNEQRLANVSIDVKRKLIQSNLSIYVETFNNEFVTQPRDFFLDPTVEIDAYVSIPGFSGLITPFPKTVALYNKRKCDAFTEPELQPPSFIKLAFDPEPVDRSQVLTESNVAEPPLPPVSDKPPSVPEPADAAPIGQPRACVLISSSVMLFTLVLLTS